MMLLFTSLVTLFLSITLHCGQPPQGSTKRKWDHKDILEQMAQKRHQSDRAVIAMAEKIGEKKVGDLMHSDKKFITETLHKPEHIPILNRLCYSPLLQGEEGQQFKNTLLRHCVVLYKIIPAYAAVLLSHGAKSDYKKPDAERWDIPAYEIVLGNRNKSSAHYELFVTFMQFDKNPAFKEKCSELLLNLSKEEANVLLYHGVVIPKSIPFLHSHLSLFEQAHARRVFRMAHFLARWVKLPLPVELCFIIAEHRYGKLSQHDRELMYTYKPDDYKKVRPSCALPSSGGQASQPLVLSKVEESP